MTVEQLNGGMAEWEPEMISEPTPEQPVVAAAPVVQAVPVPEAVPQDEPLGVVAPAAEETPLVDAAEAPAGAEAAPEPERVAVSVVEPEATPARAAVEPGATLIPERPAPGTTWPFLVYDVLWLAFAAALVWLFAPVPETQAIYEAPLYPLTLVVAIVLMAAGPLLVLVTWLFGRDRSSLTSGHLFVSVLMKGSMATLGGAALWWGALLVLDQIRLGRFM